MSPARIDQILQKLTGAQANKLPWHDIAQLTDEVRESGQWREHYRSPSEWVQNVSNVSGYSFGILMRMMAARRFLADIAKKRGDAWLASFFASNPPFSATEMLMRLYGVNPEAAEEFFPMIIEGKAGYTKIKKAYDGVIKASLWGYSGSQKLVTPKVRGSSVNLKGSGMLYGGLSASKLGIRRSSELTENLFHLVKGRLDAFTELDAELFYFRRYRFRYASPHAIAVKLKGAGIVCVDGFEFRPAATYGFLFMRRILAEISLSATFFRRYWIFIPDENRFSQRLVKGIQDLDLKSVGVVTIDDKMNFKTMIKPKGPPVPDRQEYGRIEVLAQGA